MLCAFLTSKLSATALIGLLSGFKFLIIIVDFSLTVLPNHLRGLKGLIGAIDSFLEFKLKIGPCTDKLYAVLPAGVDTKTPSETSFLIINFDPTLIDRKAACLLCLGPGWPRIQGYDPCLSRCMRSARLRAPDAFGGKNPESIRS